MDAFIEAEEESESYVPRQPLKGGGGGSCLSDDDARMAGYDQFDPDEHDDLNGAEFQRPTFNGAVNHAHHASEHELGDHAFLPHMFMADGRLGRLGSIMPVNDHASEQFDDEMQSDEEDDEDCYQDDEDEDDEDNSYMSLLMMHHPQKSSMALSMSTSRLLDKTMHRFQKRE